jgi:molybdenum cofactor guanylyltransferase
MKILGVIIAGGAARRFGGDKAAALVDGVALIDHAIKALVPQVDALIIAGRAWRDYPMLSDHPIVGGGPLVGLCAGLRHARTNNYDAVLTAPCDLLPVPADLRERLGVQGAAVVQGQPLLGFWPASLAALLERHITGQDDHSMRGWIKISSAAEIMFDGRFWNFNRPEDVAAYHSSP